MPTSFGDLYTPRPPFIQEESRVAHHEDSDQTELDLLSAPEPQPEGKDLDFFAGDSKSESSKTAKNKRPKDLELAVLKPSEKEIGFGQTSLSDNSSNSSPMGQDPEKSSSYEPDRPLSKASGGQNGNMDSHLELRRKHGSLESPTAATQTAHMMNREDFSLDDQPPVTPITPSPDSSFLDLPRQDKRNFLLLVLLYFLQGIPMGLASGSVPFLLKSHLSYGQIGVFSLASYPYSLKLLWSPIVDAVWSPKLGRRKSWILPIQTVSGMGMIYLGGQINEMMIAAGANDGAGVWTFTWWWFFLVFLCATQDIAVDGMHGINIVRLLADQKHRLGSYFTFSAESIICVNSSDRGSDCRSLSFLYSLLGFQCPGFCQSLVSNNSQ